MSKLSKKAMEDMARRVMVTGPRRDQWIVSPAMLFQANCLMTGWGGRGRFAHMLHVKRTIPHNGWAEYYAPKMARHAKEAKRWREGPHWKWSTHKEASALERVQARFRREFVRWLRTKNERDGEYWAWELSYSDRWNLFFYGRLADRL